MKKILLIIIAMQIILNIFGAEVKLGYVFTDRLLSESNEALEIGRLFNLDKQNWQNQVRQMDEEIKKMERDFQIMKMTSNAATQKEAQARIDAKKSEAGRFIDEYFGEGGKAEKRYAELLEPLEKKIIDIINKIAEDEKYSMIFDASLRTILYAIPSMDITDQVLAELNKNTVKQTKEGESQQDQGSPNQSKASNTDIK